MSTKRRGKKETKQESPTQYKVVDPISLADLENIHTRKGKYPTRPPPFGQLTWEEAKREKEEKLKKLRKKGHSVLLWKQPQLRLWTLRRSKNLVSRL